MVKLRTLGISWGRELPGSQSGINDDGHFLVLILHLLTRKGGGTRYMTHRDSCLTVSADIFEPTQATIGLNAS